MEASDLGGLALMDVGLEFGSFISLLHVVELSDKTGVVLTEELFGLHDMSHLLFRLLHES